MRITTLRLHNYRVFQDLDLELPAGLVGIYGPNGAGKSSLLESVLWALYGRARTAKADIRTTGKDGSKDSECVVEIGLEHEDHHYLVRRSITGINATVKARVLAGDAGGAVLADGITDTARYVRSLLGMDESAFRASVFAEQKQLDAFSEHSPEQRRRLVLQLLGITPIDKARDTARADFRARQADHSRLQALLAHDVDPQARVDEARAAHDAAVLASHDAKAALARAERADADARAALTALSDAEREDELIRTLGAAARRRRDDAAAALERSGAELGQLDEDRSELASLPEPITHPDAIQAVLEGLARWSDVASRLKALGEAPDPGPEPDSTPLDALRAAESAVRADAGRAEGLVAAAKDALERAEVAEQRSGALAGEDCCPLCGQHLEAGFEEVRAHRAAELAEAHARLQELEAAAEHRAVALVGASAARRDAEQALRLAQKRHSDSLTAFRRREDLAAELARVCAAVPAGHTPEHGPALRSELAAARATIDRRALLHERLRRETTVQSSVHEAQGNLGAAELERAQLLARHAELGFDRDAFSRAKAEAEGAANQLAQARGRASSAEALLAGAVQRLADAETSLAEARRRQAALTALAEEALYLGRAADLLNGFRQTVVGMVGPHLSAHAGALFKELTGGDYDGLEIDPDTYEIKVLDAGTSYPVTRFSGSEVDLANLSLRVAISEQVGFQAGGRIGLLVLDEALASLDANRRDAMLLALTGLAAKFNQVLVVTHASEVKETLPNAIEVVKLGRHRSTARLLDRVG